MSTADLSVHRIALCALAPSFAPTLRTGVHRIQPERVVAVAVLVHIGLRGKLLRVRAADVDVQAVVVPQIEVVSVVVVHDHSSGVVGVVCRLAERRERNTIGMIHVAQLAERSRQTVALLLISRDYEGRDLFLGHNLVTVITHILNGFLAQIFAIHNVLGDFRDILAKVKDIT